MSQTGMMASSDSRHWARHAGVVCSLLLMAAGVVNAAERPTKAQERAAAEYLAAVATGDPQAVAFALHPTELDALRMRILAQLREEAARDDNTLRSRLFGPGMPLADIERLTRVGFYAALARKLYLTGREYHDVDGLVAIPDRDGAVIIVVRGKPPKERGTVPVVNVVAVKPYGKDWKAVLPSEIEAQIDDLMHGRRGIAAAAPRAAGGGAQAPGAPQPSGTKAPAESSLPPGIVELLTNAERALAAGECDEYYEKHMSPNFRRVTAKKAREALIASCQRSSATREMLSSTLRIVRGLPPWYEYEGQRAVYDLAGQGLPYDRFVLEQVDKRWYIAE